MPTRDYHAGWVPVAVRWTCPDPRRYNVRRSGSDIAVNSEVILQNAGSVASHPEIRIDGPAANPMLANADTNRSLSFQITLADGERLRIDTINGTALVGDDSVMHALTGTSAPVFDFVLAPGDNRISYTATADGGSPAVFLYRDAWI
jgi:phage-related protein